MNPRHIPNIISVIRILLVGPVIVLILRQQFDGALGLFVVAGVSDAVDGYLAKTYHWQSRLGSYLDPLADKLLLISSYLTLGWLGLLPLWLAGLVVFRDTLIVAGAVAYYVLLRPFEGQPLLISKLNTLLQLTLVFAVLVDRGATPVPPLAGNLLIGLVALTTAISGGFYVYIWGTAYLRERRQTGA